MNKEVNHLRRLLAAMAVTLTGAHLGIVDPALARVAWLPVERRLPSFSGATAWLNTRPITVDQLRGKVVLVNFCTYSCINWQRSLPHVRAWARKYQDLGLVTIGVHSPEFDFEKDVVNVRRALTDLDIDYPVALDSDYAIWRAFSNEYWPALYFIDTQGNVRHHQFGEGDYTQSETVIQQLLSSAGAGVIGHDLVSVTATGTQTPADWGDLKTPESYVGYARAERFGSPGGLVRDTASVYTAPAALELNHWALAGNWTVGKQATVLNGAGGRIVCRFHARDVHLVLAPPAGGTTARLRVLIDGHAPGAAHGLDVDSAGNGTVTQPRLYQLIRQPLPIVDRQFEVTFLDPGIKGFALTFG